MRIDRELIGEYLRHCAEEARLDEKTIKAYRCDLMQFSAWARGAEMCRGSIRAYLVRLNRLYSQRTVRRKIASLKAFASYRSRESCGEGRPVANPFAALRLVIREPKRLPRVIPYEDVRCMLEPPGPAPDCPGRRGRRTRQPATAADVRELRDRAIVELLISTGIRVSELCRLNRADCDLLGRSLRIFGKGAKERVVQLESDAAIAALEGYLQALDAMAACEPRMGACAAGWQPSKPAPSDGGAMLPSSGAAPASPLFLNRFGSRLGDQSVRSIVAKRAARAGVGTHITPHMFRHTFATVLLEEDVDIRYIQSLLGHSSIKTTEIYTHVAAAKQREVLRLHNPRAVIAGDPPPLRRAVP